MLVLPDNPYHAATAYLATLCFPTDDDKRAALGDALAVWFIREARKTDPAMRRASRTEETKELLAKVPTRTMYNRLGAGNMRLYYRIQAVDILCWHGAASVTETRTLTRTPAEFQAQKFWLDDVKAGKFPQRPAGLHWTVGTYDNPRQVEKTVARRPPKISELMQLAKTRLDMSERNVRRLVLEESRPVMHMAMAMMAEWSNQKTFAIASYLGNAPDWIERAARTATAIQQPAYWAMVSSVCHGLATTTTDDLIHIGR